MTHDELLAKINNEGEFLAQHFDCKPVFINALRAVVELHKPDFQGSCDYCYQRDTSRYNYPCPTIQAIEKELG